MRRVKIIAEAGVNHNGDLQVAKELIRLAADAGADVVKFQTFKAEKMVTKDAVRAEYQIKNTKSDDTQYSMLKKLEMPLSWYDELISYADSLNIEFLSTGFDEESIDFLDSLNIPFFKIPSGEITNLPYLEHIASKNRPIIISTGMATIDEIRDTLNVFYNQGIKEENITILHCNTEYPTPMKDVNLKAMMHIASEFGVKVGYSDHTLGIEVPIAAVALGATVIEKHFTINRNLPGPDHKASLEPVELKAMVQSIRNIELALSGSGYKEPSESELPNKLVARKSLYAKFDINAGTILEQSHLVAKRPGDGISPMDIYKLIGRKLKKSIKAETKITFTHLES